MVGIGAGGLATCTVYQIIQRSGEVCHLRCASSTPTDCDSYDYILVTTSYGPHGRCTEEQTAKSIDNLEKDQLISVILTTDSYAIVQPCQGLATVQDDQFTSWWHGQPKPDYNEIDTHPI